MSDHDVVNSKTKIKVKLMNKPKRVNKVKQTKQPQKSKKINKPKSKKNIDDSIIDTDDDFEEEKEKHYKKGKKETDEISEPDELDETDETDETDEMDENEETDETEENEEEENEEEENEEEENEEELEEIEEPTDFENFETNNLFNGINDPVKYKILQNRSIIEEHIVPPNKRKTSHILNKTEKTELIGIRAQHIAMGAQPYVSIDTETTPVEIAEKELKEGKIPLLIKRKLNKYTYEVWDPNFMTVIWND